MPKKDPYHIWLYKQSQKNKPKRKLKKKATPKRKYDIGPAYQSPIVDKGNFSDQVGYTKQQTTDITNQLGVVKRAEERAKQQRIQERRQANAVMDKEKGASFTFPDGTTKTADQMDWRETAYVAGKSLENRGRLFPNKETFIDEWVNPLNIFGSVASGLGKAPYEAKESNSNLPYLTSIGNTALMGRALGANSINPLGRKFWTNSVSDKQFANNLLMGIPGATRKGGKAARTLKKKLFKSEIDWGKWNKEIPNNKALVKEYSTIERTTKRNGTWMKNPDGSKFTGTPEQFVQQNSKNFKAAFGESKLLNPDGSPTIQYHGTAKEFDTFDPAKFQLGDSGYSGVGIYTSPNNKVNAESYALSSAKFHTGDIKPTVMELYGLGKNPVRGHELPKGMDLFNFHRKRNYAGDVPIKEQLLNHDVAISTQRGGTRIAPDHNSYENVFPTNTQLKSATGNNGMFDMTNPNIYKTLAPIGLAGAYGLNQYRRGGVYKRR